MNEMAVEKLEKISARVWNQSQSWYYEATYKKDGHKLRVEIRRDAFDHQCVARVTRWDGAQWHQVCSRPISECKCKDVSYVSSSVSMSDFEEDEFELLQEALAIVL